MSLSIPTSADSTRAIRWLGTSRSRIAATYSLIVESGILAPSTRDLTVSGDGFIRGGRNYAQYATRVFADLGLLPLYAGPDAEPLQSEVMRCVKRIRRCTG